MRTVQKDKNINFSIDLEDTLEDNKAPFIPVFNHFLENNHPETMESRDKYTADEIEGWGFEPFSTVLAGKRGWEERDEEDTLLFVFGEHPFYSEDELKETKQDYGSVWPGFQEVMNNVFKGKPENFPLYDTDTPDYFAQLKEEFPDSRVDIVTSRTDVDVLLDRTEGYGISEDLRQGLDEYASIHGLHDVIDELVVAGDKATHENDYSIFFDDKPNLSEDLSERQYQVVHTTEANQHLDIPTYQELKNEKRQIEEDNQIRVYSVEEGFEAMNYIGKQIQKDRM